jgi:hypothetical protein
MSCITEILRVKGDKEYLVVGGIAIEKGGTYKGFEYLITFTSRGHRCGYVAVPETHPAWHKSEDYDVYGGITFFEQSHFAGKITGHVCTDKWLGFDAMHIDDGKDYGLIKKIFGNCEKTMNELGGLKYIDERFAMHMGKKIQKPKTKEFMIRNCKSLIRQLVKEQQ